MAATLTPSAGHRCGRHQRLRPVGGVSVLRRRGMAGVPRGNRPATGWQAPALRRNPFGVRRCATQHGEIRAAAVLVELSDTLAQDFDVDHFASTLTQRCLELLPIDGAAVLLGDERLGIHVSGWTDDRVRLLELVEVQMRDGPCIESLRTGIPLFNVSLTRTAAVWPRYAPEAVRLGFAQLHAIPLRRGQAVVGALDLFARHVTPMSLRDMKLAQSMAEVATIGILHNRSRRHALERAGQLQAALDSRVVIEQAKGVLAERFHVDMAEAFAILRHHARQTNTRVADLARDVVNGSVRLEWPTQGHRGRHAT